MKYAKRHYVILGLVCGVIYVRLQGSVPIFLARLFNSPHIKQGARGGVVFKALRYKPVGRGFGNSSL